jgi:hypothetical protein
MEARMMVEQEAERVARLTDQQRMVEMFQYMQSLGAAQGFAPPPLLFPPANPAQFHTPVSIKVLVLHDIYSSGITHAISSLGRDNLRHPTTLIDCLAHCRTSPATHLVDDLLLVVIVRLVRETWYELMFVKNLCLRVGNTYIGETWYEHNMFVKNL